MHYYRYVLQSQIQTQAAITERRKNTIIAQREFPVKDQALNDSWLPFTSIMLFLLGMIVQGIAC